MVNYHLKKVSQYLLSLLCFCGFVYHSHDLYVNYMSGKTVANIKVDSILNQMLPAITVCIIPKYKLGGIEENNALTDELKKHFNQIKRGKNGGYIKIPDVLNYLTANMSMVDFIEKVNRPIQDRYLLIASIIGQAPDSIKDTGAEQNHEAYIIKKGIESLLMKISDQIFADLHSCLTFFSHLQKEWRDIKINLIGLDLIIRNQDFEFDEAFYLAIHSQNSLPKLLVVLNIQFNIQRSEHNYSAQVLTQTVLNTIWTISSRTIT